MNQSLGNLLISALIGVMNVWVNVSRDGNNIILLLDFVRTKDFYDESCHNLFMNRLKEYLTDWRLKVNVTSFLSVIENI